MQEKSDTKRRRILEAALKAFAKYGFEKATIKQIAREAKLSTTSLIYWYFRDKNELFLAVLAQSSPFFQNTKASDELMERPPEEVLPQIARTYLDTFDNPDVCRTMRIFLSEAAKKEAIGTYFAKAAMLPIFNSMVEYFQKQVTLGRLKPHDSQSVVRSFLGTLVIYVLGREIFHPMREGLPDKEKYIQEITSTFLNGLRP